MPHAVNADARNWIRRGIVSGRGYDGRLVLKGNLQDFPFRDPAQGEFSVTAKAADVRIDYAPGWPLIDHVDAEMSFGIGMKINAQRGEILGARLSGVQVAIPDFESHDELLKIAGRAEGQTADFLRFVSQSPVADKIDRFTDGMKASGDGVLDLHLDLPLRRVAEARLRADYAFRNNLLQVVPGLPPLAQVNGRLQITESSVQARDIEGKAFGGGFQGPGPQPGCAGRRAGGGDRGDPGGQPAFRLAAARPLERQYRLEGEYRHPPAQCLGGGRVGTAGDQLAAARAAQQECDDRLAAADRTVDARCQSRAVPDQPWQGRSGF